MLFESASSIAQRIRAREVSSLELTTLLLDRIDEVNPLVNAICEIDRARALAEAAAAGKTPGKGPLHGVPMTVKDGFHATGLHTTWGNPEFKDYVSSWDATVVRRLKDAGAIIIGKSNVAYMMADFGQSMNELFGRVHNPFDPAAAAGGSSGGAAAAIAAGLTFLEYGSDLAGSIRIPASFCGVYGLKPSAGIVPLTGFQPPGPPRVTTDLPVFGAVGPLARSATDLRLALNVTAGPQDSKALSWRLPPPRHQRLTDFRIGGVFDDDRAQVTDDVAALIADAIAPLSVTHGWPQDIDLTQSWRCFGFQVELFLAQRQPGAELPSFETYLEQEKLRLAARQAWSRYFEDFDVFLCPVNFTAPFPHDNRPFEERMIGDRSYLDQSFWIAHASLAGLPAVSVPVGLTAAGLPVGLQVVGPFEEDDTAITFAELLADITGGFQRPAL